ncbi:MAG: hypothetical protein CALGDGBN_01348 [Pseudomonadales bacterium]|nr:hypothetical protein [Pseudomonadales bacterium]
MQPKRWSIARLQRPCRVALGIALPLVFVLSLLPDQPGPQFSHGDKLLHALAFCMFALLARGGWPERAAARWLWMLLGYGAAIELAQSLLPWRQASLLDWLADAAGIALGAALFAWQARARRAVAPV